MEEGLQRPGLAAVIGQPASLDLTAGRRLQLAAEGSGTLCVVLTDAAMAGAGVATTRWRVAAAPSGPAFAADARDFGLARARWQVTLTRCRGAVPAVGETDFGCWLVEEGGPATSPVARPVTAAAADIARSRAG
jgi:protein ImuA